MTTGSPAVRESGAEPEVRGKLASLGTGSFTVNGQPVFVDDSPCRRTGMPDCLRHLFHRLGNGNEVEVHAGGHQGPASVPRG